jgi:hypothetical protein
MGDGSCSTAYCCPVGLGCLATAEVAERPGSISQHAQFPAVTQEIEERTESSLLENKITASWAITGDVAKRPHSLLTDIWLVAAEEFDKDRDSAGFNDNLSLLGRAGGNVCESPGGLELYQSVGRAQELDESADHAGLNDPLDRWISFFRQQFSEFGGGLDLLVDLLGKDTLDHLGQFFVKLQAWPG